jgi:hypothetical protein
LPAAATPILRWINFATAIASAPFAALSSKAAQSGNRPRGTRMATEHPVILHHFPQSPFSEKIRLIFGLKNIAWTSVEITRIMPRPDLMPMTGG